MLVSEGTDWMKPDEPLASVDLKTEIPHSARIYDFILGGKDNYAADRAAAAAIVKQMPSMPARCAPIATSWCG